MKDSTQARIGFPGTATLLVRAHGHRGFTIVELLIVVVVIAILATITIVAYNGIQNRANDSVVQSDMRNTYNKILQYQVVNSVLPNTSAVTLKDILVATKNSYSASGTTNTYIYCKTNTDAAVAGQSKSMTGYFYGTQGSGTIPASSWISAGASLCPLAGINSTDPGFGWLWFCNTGAWLW